MKTASITRSITMAALVTAFSGMAWSDNSHRMISAEDLKWTDLPSLPPGAKLAVIEGPLGEAVPVTARIKFPANYRLPAHIHPHFERVTGLTGAFYMGMGDKLDAENATMVLRPGDMMIMEPNTPHFAMTKEETIVQLHGPGPWSIVYVNPDDDPRKKSQ
ncbi:cupin domain-containing protein [Methylibium sp.]|uniref:cupin domain-containing protein n=1 Tax=Methylibium sp. TaxID=2067992 RepID=UPI0025FE67FB|nr:cupin domain-containing protein [Methylibium sp.]